MKIRLEEYIRDDGANPYQEWFNGLDAQAAAKVTTAKARLDLGNTYNIELNTRQERRRSPLLEKERRHDTYP